jgi:hypothetical protein
VARVAALNRTTMSTYLWHMPALALVAVVARPFGLANRADSYREWLWQRPIWFGLGTVFLVGIVALVGWAERIGRLSPGAADWSRPQVGGQHEHNSGGECGADALWSSRQR